MNETELQKIIIWIDASLDVFRANQGKLSVPEIQMWSMLTVVRKELVAEVARTNVGERNRP
jgi:hypothetical protein